MVAWFIIGVVGGVLWPNAAGCEVLIGALGCLVLGWYVDHSPTGMFDETQNFGEMVIMRAFLPWVAGTLVGAIWMVIR